VRRHRTTLNATHVFRRLLVHPALDETLTPAAIQAANEWLEQHPTAVEATYVLRPLLNRSTLTVADAAVTNRAALAWVVKHGTKESASFVIGPLLTRELSKPEASFVLESACAWLKLHSSKFTASYVLPGLMSSDKLAGDQCVTAIGAAITWLREHGTTPAASYVLEGSLTRKDLTDAETFAMFRAAAVWLDANWTEVNDVSRMLKTLVNNRETPVRFVEAIGRRVCVTPWNAESHWTLSRLLTRKPFISFELWMQCGLLLATHVHDGDAPDTLKTHLGRNLRKRAADLTPEQARAWSAAVSGWREAHRGAALDLVAALDSIGKTAPSELEDESGVFDGGMHRPTPVTAAPDRTRHAKGLRTRTRP
jgi:hypothetical protein